MKRPVNGQALAEAARIEAAELIRLAAGTNVASETTKARIARAASTLDWSPSRVEDIWKQEPGVVIRSWEMDQLRKLIGT